MSNADLIANLRGDNLKCNCYAWSRSECGCDTNWPESYCNQAADALELADKRIAELECILAGQQILGHLPKGIVTGTVYGLTVDELYTKIVQADEAERKLAVARESLSVYACMSEAMSKPARKALAQIGGDDAGT